MDLLNRPRPHIAKYHPVDSCCDAAKRMSDVMTLHAICGQAGRWCLIRLIDGSSDDTAYDSREDAERFKRHPATIAVMIPPAGTSAAEAEEVLHYHREVFDQLGGRPLEMPNLIQPLLVRDQRRQIRALRRSR